MWMMRVTSASTMVLVVLAFASLKPRHSYKFVLSLVAANVDHHNDAHTLLEKHGYTGKGKIEKGGSEKKDSGPQASAEEAKNGGSKSAWGKIKSAKGVISKMGAAVAEKEHQTSKLWAQYALDCPNGTQPGDLLPDFRVADIDTVRHEATPHKTLPIVLRVMCDKYLSRGSRGRPAAACVVSARLERKQGHVLFIVLYCITPSTSNLLNYYQKGMCIAHSPHPLIHCTPVYFLFSPRRYQHDLRIFSTGKGLASSAST